jgi:hypothetical protein
MTSTRKHRDAGHSREPSRPPARRGSRPPESPEARKVRTLDEIAEQLRQGNDFPVTRLTTLKGLCEDSAAAGAFALFLTRKAQKAMREKGAPQRYRRLVN